MPDTAALSTRLEKLTDAVVARVSERAVRPSAVCRMQFHCKFTLHDAAAVVPYLHDLGVSHVYASPYFQSRSGSQHGYDVCNYGAVNPELGGMEGLRAFVDALSKHGMGHILDVVPNHMAAVTENPWWRDVLENGPNSPYSGYFDIDWHPVKDELENKVLLPILGAQYGDVLEQGQLKIEHRDGGFEICYFQSHLPLGPKSSIPVLRHRIDELQTTLGAGSEDFSEYESILTALEYLPPQNATSAKAVAERQREKEVIKRRLRDLETRVPVVGEFVARNIEIFNGVPGDPESFDRLDRLLHGQAYRPSHWRAASDEINYRRFFDVNELAAVCMEKPEVFHAANEFIMKLAADGDLQGLRVDHVDGLFGPETYLYRLQWSYLSEIVRVELERANTESAASSEFPDGPTFAANDLGHANAPAGESSRDVGSGSVLPSPTALLRNVCRRLGLRIPTGPDFTAVFGPTTIAEMSPEELADLPTSEPLPENGAAPRPPLFVVVEKILGPDEPLPETWPVAGTTGYDFTNQLNGLFIDPAGWTSAVKLFTRFTDDERSFPEIVRECKLLILKFAMVSELQMLAHHLNRISEQHRATRDFTLNSLRYALREVLASFPVYRTYPTSGGVSDRDQRFVTRAVASARRRNRSMDPGTFDFIRDVLLLRHPPNLSASAREAREFFAGRFQQVTSPIMAKGVEDTAFYVYFPLASVNEVGGDPASAAVDIDAFHQHNLRRRALTPGGLLATSTHDTKRSEDVRARLNLLSEIPQVWQETVQRFSRRARRWRVEVDGLPAPSQNDEYLFYQSLIGIWPEGEVDDAARGELVARLLAYMEKATHESKQRTSWINPNTEYDQAVRKFVEECLTPGRNNKFLPDFQAFLPMVVDAGYFNGMSQVVLKLLSPGVPDVYQGQEFWDFSLVDPDNRRPVDYTARAEALCAMRNAWDTQPADRARFAADLAAKPSDPRMKLFLTWRLLELRRKTPQLFADGDYLPLNVVGPAAEHVVAFVRRSIENDSAGPSTVIVVVPRWWIRLAKRANVNGVLEIPTATEQVWADTVVELPAEFPSRFADVFTGELREVQGTALRLSELFSGFPIVVLANHPDSWL